jgi:hypothetical protein
MLSTTISKIFGLQLKSGSDQTWKADFFLNGLALKSEGSVQRHRNWNQTKSTSPVFNMKKSHVVDHNFENFRSAVKEWK